MAETMTFQAAAYSALGTKRDQVNLPADLFDGTVNMPVMHKAVQAFLANNRQGNASTKTRGLVIGGNQKPWKQKGTGRARQGSTRAPQWPGGGTVFGPTPRAYDHYVPRQMRALARKSAFNARARENAIFVIDAFQYDAPKTSRLLTMLVRLGLSDQKVLILTDGAKPNVYLSGRNVRTVQVLPYSDVSTYHLLWSDVVLIESSAIGEGMAPLNEKEEAPAPKKSVRNVAPAAPARSAAKKTAVKKTVSTKAKAPAKKVAAKKTAAKKTTAKKPAAKKKTAAKTSAAKKAAPKKKEK